MCPPAPMPAKILSYRSRRHEIKRQCANAILEASIQEEANEYLPATNHASIRLIIKSAYVFT